MWDYKKLPEVFNGASKSVSFKVTNAIELDDVLEKINTINDKLVLVDLTEDSFAKFNIDGRDNSLYETKVTEEGHIEYLVLKEPYRILGTVFTKGSNTYNSNINIFNRVYLGGSYTTNEDHTNNGSSDYYSDSSSKYLINDEVNLHYINVRNLGTGKEIENETYHTFLYPYIRVDFYKPGNNAEGWEKIEKTSEGEDFGYYVDLDIETDKGDKFRYFETRDLPTTEHLHFNGWVDSYYYDGYTQVDPVKLGPDGIFANFYIMGSMKLFNNTTDEPYSDGYISVTRNWNNRVRLYSDFTGDKVNVTFDPNNEKIETAFNLTNKTQTYEFAKKFGSFPTFNAAVNDRQVATVEGWYTKDGTADDWGTKITADTYFWLLPEEEQDTVTLYAKWTDVSGKIRIKANYATKTGAKGFDATYTYFDDLSLAIRALDAAGGSKQTTYSDINTIELST